MMDDAKFRDRQLRSNFFDCLADQNAFKKVVSKDRWIKIRVEEIDATNKADEDFFELARYTDSNCAIRMKVETSGNEISAKWSNGSAAVLHF
jgi:hypothetical protein